MFCAMKNVRYNYILGRARLAGADLVTAPDYNLIGARRLRRFIARKPAGQFIANVIQTLKRPQGRAPGREKPV